MMGSDVREQKITTFECDWPLTRAQLETMIANPSFTSISASECGRMAVVEFRRYETDTEFVNRLTTEKLNAMKYNKKHSPIANPSTDHSPFKVVRNFCNCHPETCTCNDWVVVDALGTRLASFFSRVDAEALIDNLNGRKVG